MATPEQILTLRNYVNAPSGEGEDAELSEAVDRAEALVTKFVTDNGVELSDVPDVEQAGSIKEVAAEFYHRRKAPNGISQFADASGNPVRVARDPMAAAYRTLGAYLPLGFGLGSNA